MEGKQFQLGDVVQMKKAHPWGAMVWYVIRLGLYIRMNGVNGGRRVLPPRRDFERGLRKVLRSKGGDA